MLLGLRKRHIGRAEKVSMLRISLVLLRIQVARHGDMDQS